MAYIVTLTVRAECSVRVPSLVGPYYEHGNVKEYLKCNHEANRMKLVTVLKLSKLWSLSCNSPTQVTQITSAPIFMDKNYRWSMETSNQWVSDNTRLYGIPVHIGMQENILINNNLEASISLSSSRMIGSPKSTTNMKGTYRWMAIERFNVEETPPSTTKSDVWAFGMTVVEVCRASI